MKNKVQIMYDDEVLERKNDKYLDGINKYIPIIKISNNK